MIKHKFGPNYILVMMFVANLLILTMRHEYLTFVHLNPNSTTLIFMSIIKVSTLLIYSSLFGTVSCGLDEVWIKLKVKFVKTFNSQIVSSNKLITEILVVQDG